MFITVKSRCLKFLEKDMLMLQKKEIRKFTTEFKNEHKPKRCL